VKKELLWKFMPFFFYPNISNRDCDRGGTIDHYGQGARAKKAHPLYIHSFIEIVMIVHKLYSHSGGVQFCSVTVHKY
jgi:hypothetical protein